MDTLADYNNQIRPSVSLPTNISIAHSDVVAWLKDEHALTYSSSQANKFVYQLTTETIGLWVQALTAAFAQLKTTLTHLGERDRKWHATKRLSPEKIMDVCEWLHRFSILLRSRILDILLEDKNLEEAMNAKPSHGMYPFAYPLEFNLSNSDANV